MRLRKLIWRLRVLPLLFRWAWWKAGRIIEEGR